MAQSVEINLISSVYVKNDAGDLVPMDTPRPVMADKMSVRQSEFYQAAAAGLKPEVMYVVMAAEYRGERRLTEDGKKYTVIRTYERPDERVELICSGPVVSN